MSSGARRASEQLGDSGRHRKIHRLQIVRVQEIDRRGCLRRKHTAFTIGKGYATIDSGSVCQPESAVSYAKNIDPCRLERF